MLLRKLILLGMMIFTVGLAALWEEGQLVMLVILLLIRVLSRCEMAFNFKPKHLGEEMQAM